MASNASRVMRATGVYTGQIGANRIAAQGFGLAKPIEKNATPEGRARNRRVEFARKCPQVTETP